MLALLVIGNFFCFACPFTFARDLARRILPGNRQWPRWLRTKWISVALLGIYLWSYEAFSLWNSPWLTAWVIIGYFVAAIVVDGFFRGASFCKYVCPIGQFHFVQSLVSPFEVKTRDLDVCRSCKSFDCIKGNEQQRGCELRLFQPKKESNLDCTFCLDCVRACPHDNIGIIAVTPGRTLARDQFRSSIGRFAERTDLAALVLVLVFGAFLNAASMTLPVENALSFSRLTLDLIPRPVILFIFFALALGLLPLVAVSRLRIGQPAVRRYHYILAGNHMPVCHDLRAARLRHVVSPFWVSSFHCSTDADSRHSTGFSRPSYRYNRLSVVEFAHARDPAVAGFSMPGIGSRATG